MVEALHHAMFYIFGIVLVLNSIIYAASLSSSFLVSKCVMNTRNDVKNLMEMIKETDKGDIEATISMSHDCIDAVAIVNSNARIRKVKGCNFISVDGMYFITLTKNSGTWEKIKSTARFDFKDTIEKIRSDKDRCEFLKASLNQVPVIEKEFVKSSNVPPSVIIAPQNAEGSTSYCIKMNIASMPDGKEVSIRSIESGACS